jgi:hypothetical protein
MFRTVST